MNIPESTRKRFESFVYPDPNSGCYIWGGAVNPQGYGLFRTGVPREQLAHRFAWILSGRTIPQGLCVLHSCDMPCCVDPHHLFIDTRDDNNKDKAMKLRGIGGTGRYPYGVQKRWKRFAAYGFAGGSVYLGAFDTCEEAARVADEYRKKRFAR